MEVKMFAITGITGQVGGATARMMLASGQQVRAVVRSADKGAPWAERGCEVAVADMNDTAALAKAFSGVASRQVRHALDCGRTCRRAKPPSQFEDHGRGPARSADASRVSARGLVHGERHMGCGCRESRYDSILPAAARSYDSDGVDRRYRTGCCRVA